MKVAIIGGKNLTYYLAKGLISRGYRVYVVNKDEEYCVDLAKRLKKVTTIVGDGARRHVLEQLELSEEDQFIALTPNDQDNLIACLTAQRLLGIRRPIALINDPDNKEVFAKMGITAAISPIEMISMTLEDSLFREQITNLIPASEKLSVFRIDLHSTAPVIGKMLKDLELPEESVIGAIIRGDEVIIPRGNTQISENDTLIVLSNPAVQSKVFEALLGEV